MAVQGPGFGGGQWDTGDADQWAVGQEEPKWSHQPRPIPWNCQLAPLPGKRCKDNYCAL